MTSQSRQQWHTTTVGTNKYLVALEHDRPVIVAFNQSTFLYFEISCLKLQTNSLELQNKSLKLQNEE